MLLVIIVTLLVWAQVPPPANTAPVGWWRFEEGRPGSAALGPVLDSSGHGFSATPYGGPLYSAEVTPLARATGSTRSMYFDGGTTRLFVPDQPLFQLRSLTIEACFKTLPMLPGAGSSADILVRGDVRPGQDPYRLSLFQPGNILYFQVEESQNHVYLSYTVPFDEWVYAAGTFDDATGQMKLYVNGQLVGSTKTTIHPLLDLVPRASPGIGIGCDGTGQYGEHFKGWLDEVRLSDRALQPGELLIPRKRF
jgi:hypothetical protein